MINICYPRLFKSDPVLLEQSKDIASRTYELPSYLSDVVKDPSIYGAYKGSVTYHDSCSGHP
jgi:L-lactate dehydrogenase complex protein LldE